MHPDLQGHVDVTNKFMLRGWALRRTELANGPLVEVVQEDRLIAAVAPSIAAPNLLAALKINAPAQRHCSFVWHLPLPLTIGLRPDVPFVIRFRDNQAPLGNGNRRVIPLMEGIEPGAQQDLLTGEFFLPSLYEPDTSKLRLAFLAFGHVPSPDGTLALYFNAEPRTVRVLPFGDQELRMLCLGRRGVSGAIELTPDDFPKDDRPLRISLSPPELEGVQDRAALHRTVRSLWVPHTAIDKTKLLFSIPSLDNIRRVSGPGSTEWQYLVGGYTTFNQLDVLARHYFGRQLCEFKCVVDWGAGCARVMRHFFEEPENREPLNNKRQIHGTDIDAVNVNWCQHNMQDHGRYHLLELNGHLPFDNESVDFLYGISVMTHLSEHAQFKWLDELRRVMIPGGCVILTTHGEFVTYQDYRGAALPYVERFGFFDGVPDPALGEELSTYYRTTYHARGYIRTHWSEYFDLVDVIPGANAFRQDFVVLRARGPKPSRNNMTRGVFSSQEDGVSSTIPTTPGDATGVPTQALGTL